MSAALAAGVVLEHLLFPQLHDAHGHLAVVRDAYGHTCCLECTGAALQQQQPPLPVLRRKRLLLGLEAALELLLCLGPHGPPPQQHQHQHQHDYHPPLHYAPDRGLGGCPLTAAEAAQRVLAPLLACVLRPIPDPHEREEMDDALVSAMLKTVEAATSQAQQHGDVLPLLGAIYVPLLDAVREQGLRHAGHLLRLAAALLAPDDLSGLLLPPTADPNAKGNGSSGGSGGSQSQALSPPSTSSAATFTASFLAFLELIAAELAAPLPHRGGGGGGGGGGSSSSQDNREAVIVLRLELLVLLRRICEAPPARAWVVRQRLAPRVFGSGFFQSMQGMVSGGGGGGLGADLQRNLLALALLLLPSPAREPCCGDGGGESSGGGEGTQGEAGGDGGVAVEELLRWHAEQFCPAVVKPLLLSSSAEPQLQEGAAAFVARLVQARPEAAEGLVEAELAEHLLESLRVLLRPSHTAASIVHHAASLQQLSRAAPSAFYSIAHFPPVLFSEMLALLHRVLMRSGSGGPAAPQGQGGGEGEDDDDEEEWTLLALLEVVEGALSQTTILFSEDVMAALLQSLHEAVARQQRRQRCSPFLRQLALFVGRYASSEVINNKALFPAPPQLEALLSAVGALLHALLQLPPRPGALMAAAFPLLQVSELVAARAGRKAAADTGDDQDGGRGQALLPALVEAAAALATLAGVQAGCSGLPEDYTFAVFLRRILALLPPAFQQRRLLVRHLLDAGLLEAALLRLAGPADNDDGGGDGESHAAFVVLATQLLTHGAGLGGGEAKEVKGPLLALARDLQQHLGAAAVAAGEGEGVSDSTPDESVHRWLLGALRRLADPQQLQRWVAMGTGGSLCTLDALLVVWLCIGRRIPHDDASNALRGLATSVAAAPSASLDNLTPTTVALLLRLAAGSTDSLLLERGAAAVLTALLPPMQAEYTHKHVGRGLEDQPDHLAFLLRQGNQQGPQACWRLLLRMEQQQQQLHDRFVAALRVFACHAGAAAELGKSILALLVHGLNHALASPSNRDCLRSSMQHLLAASGALGPALWGADAEGTRAVLVLLHDRVLPALAASIGSTNDDEWQHGHESLLLVVRAASAALVHGPRDGDLPFLPLFTRLILLLGPRNGDNGSTPPPEVVVAVLAFLNQLVALGRLAPDAARTAAALDLAWTTHAAVGVGATSAPAALMANAMLHALLSLPPDPSAGVPTHHFYGQAFLTSCLVPQEPPPVRKAALVLLCRLLQHERAQQQLQQERQRPRRRQHRDKEQQQKHPPSNTGTMYARRLRLAAQGCLLEPALRGPAAAVLLQLLRLLPAAATVSAWDAFLLRAPQALLPPTWPEAPSIDAAYVALYLSASLQHQARRPHDGMACGDEDKEEQRALADHLLHWLGGTCAALAQGRRDTLPASYPVALQLLLAMVAAGALTDAQRGQLREFFHPQASRSSSTVPDDARTVSASSCQEQQRQGGGEGEEEGVWWPQELLECWMRLPGGVGAGKEQRQHKGEEAEEEGQEAPTCPSEVDLALAVARLRELLVE